MFISLAHTGNTQSQNNEIGPGLDHPRPCGEYIDGQDAAVGRLGSPPPVRGILDVFHLQSLLIRITPARAGNTPCPSILQNSF